jgi:lysophospholipase-2
MAKLLLSIVLLITKSHNWMCCVAGFAISNHTPRASPSRLFLTSDEINSPDESVEVESSEPRNTRSDKVAVIFLHGLGDSSEGWSKLAEALPNLRPNLAKLDITYVFPPAYTISITVNGGEQMPGWFDVYDWPIGISAKDDPKGLAISVKRIEQIVTQLQEEEGIDPSRMILGGFSQGGAVALMAAYNRRKKDAPPFAGCCVLSGWLPMKDYLDVSEETATSTPLFWAHGQHDDKILFEQQILGVKKLKGVGVDVTSVSYPVGHESANFEEIEAMADFIDRVLGPGNEKVGVKWANEQSMSDDEVNEVLYYLCALAPNSVVSGAS